MSVTKRIRYEVLRRDNHTCRYCHATDQPLTIDHVVPVALGGTDDPSNLVAACKDCNAGKSSSSPDGTFVAQVKDDALRQAKQIEQAYAVLVERMGVRDEYIDEFVEAFRDQPAPSDWRNTIGRWFEMGVPIELVVDAAQIASSKSHSFTGTGRFAYMCGIVWNQVHAVREVTSSREAIEASIISPETLDGELCDAWRKGYDAGYNRGWESGAGRYMTNDIYGELLSVVSGNTNFSFDAGTAFPGSPQISDPDVWAAR